MSCSHCSGTLYIYYYTCGGNTLVWVQQQDLRTDENSIYDIIQKQQLLLSS